MNTTDSISDILERICTLFRNEVRLVGLEYGLHPVHLEVLHYLARCNGFSDTPAAVTEFLGLTKGTTSQSISLLESKGFLEKVKDTNDRRVSHLKLTEQGKVIATKAIPPASLKSSLQKMDDDSSKHLHKQLEELLRDAQQATGNVSFGICKTCQFHDPISAQHFHCRLTGQQLEKQMGELICREHIPVVEK